jgi:hypothetical protein
VTREVVSEGRTLLLAAQLLLEDFGDVVQHRLQFPLQLRRVLPHAVRERARQRLQRRARGSSAGRSGLPLLSLLVSLLLSLSRLREPLLEAARLHPHGGLQAV